MAVMGKSSICIPLHTFTNNFIMFFIPFLSLKDQKLFPVQTRWVHMELFPCFDHIKKKSTFITLFVHSDDLVLLQLCGTPTL